MGKYTHLQHLIYVYLSQYPPQNALDTNNTLSFVSFHYDDEKCGGRGMVGLGCSGCGSASSGHLGFGSPAELCQCQECWVTSCIVQDLGVTFLNQC